MARISYSDDFRREAVRLVVVEGHSRKRVARDLGISLDRWRILPPVATPVPFSRGKRSPSCGNALSSGVWR